MVRRRRRDANVNVKKMPGVVSSCRIWQCSVCDGSFGTKKSWLCHLLLPEHQDKARIQCFSWDSDVRDCVVVAYSSFPVANEEVLIYFSKGCDTVVTNFVWFPNRPKMGIVQFESRWKAHEVFSNINGPQLRIQNQLVQLKRGTDLLDLEWMEMMPDGLMVDATTTALHESLTPDGPLADSPKEVKVKKEDKKEAVGTRSKYLVMVVEAITELNKKKGSSLKAIKKYLSSVHNLDVEEQEVYIIKALKKAVKRGTLITQSKDSGTTDLFMLAVPKKRSKTVRESKQECEPISTDRSETTVVGSDGLVAQFNEIRREVEIPDDQYNMALDIIKKLEHIFKPRLPRCKLYMMRHWYVKMKNNGSNHLILFVDDIDEFSGNQRTNEIRRVRSVELKEILLTTDSQTKLPCTHIGTDIEGKIEGFYNQQTGMKFFITANPFLIAETQGCRLLRYMCTYDPRAVPFFTLINFWARINAVKFADDVNRNRFSVPEPAALEWLLMFFLSHTGVLPSPREVQERPHTPTFFDNRDIGFSPDAEFRKNWKSSSSSTYSYESVEFVLEILKLAQSFFLFYYNLKTRAVVLNTRDGELIPKESLIVKGKSKLTDDEILYLHKLIVLSNERILRGQLVLLHPLCFVKEFSLSQSNFNNKTSFYMKHSADKIAKFLESNVTVGCVDLKSLLTIDLELVSSEATALSESQIQKNDMGVILQPVLNGTELEVSANPYKAITDKDARSSLARLLGPQFNEIRFEMEIANDRYKTALQIIEKLENILRTKFPSCKVYMLRHWYLKLWNHGANNLLLFVDDIDELSGNNQDMQKAGAMELKETILSFSPVKFSFLSIEDHRMEFVCLSSGIHFWILYHPTMVVEAQSCRLLKYLCTFDSRAIAVVTLVHYWSRINDIWFGRFGPVPELEAQDPAAFEWLVASFLGSKRIIPTPREIMDRPHKPVYFADHNIGFSEDETFTSQWRTDCSSSENPDEFVFSVLELVREFFLFSFRLASKSIVINTKDGEILRRQLFHDVAKGDKVDAGVQTKLTSQELSLLCKAFKGSHPRFMGCIVILHPLYWLATFSFNRKFFITNVRKLLYRCVQKMDLALQGWIEGGTSIDLKSLLHIGIPVNPESHHSRTEDV
ncbi:unnamed protein product [Orchesella dallaii]|uniref:H15 domain-containing protein n=1 Tax=Orchesella dallaii TaxID=48710 RepID=A0ABP1RFT7_9HEXA